MALSINFIDSAMKTNALRLFCFYCRIKIGITNMFRHFIKKYPSFFMSKNLYPTHRNTKETVFISNRWFSDNFDRDDDDSLVAKDIQKHKLEYIHDDFRQTNKYNLGLLKSRRKYNDENAVSNSKRSNDTENFDPNYDEENELDSLNDVVIPWSSATSNMSSNLPGRTKRLKHGFETREPSFDEKNDLVTEKENRAVEDTDSKYRTRSRYYDNSVEAPMRKKSYKKAISSVEEGVIQNKIKSAVNVSDVLRIIREDRQNMTVEDYPAITEALFQLQKSENTHLNKEQLRRTQEISDLCSDIKKNVRWLGRSGVLTILKCLLSIDISAQSLVIQMLLQMLAKSVNELNLQQIMFLDMLLRNTEFSPLSEALKIALPIVFNAQVRIQLDYDNPAAMIQCFNYAIRKNVSTVSFDVIVNNLISAMTMITCNDAYNIVKAFLSYRHLKPSHQKLYYQCMDLIASRLNNFEINDIIFLLTRMARQYKYSCESFYYEKFINSIASYVSSQKFSIDVIARLLQPLNRLDFVSIEILDYLDQCALVNDHFKNKEPLYIILNMINAYTIGTYKPVNWSVYKDNLLQTLKHEKARTELPWLKIVIDLAFLDCLDAEIVATAFSKDYLSIKGDCPRTRSELLDAYQVVKSLYPECYHNSDVSFRGMIETAIKENNVDVENFPLLGTLQHIAGRPSNVLSGVLSKYGHFIDHLIVINDDNPIEINPHACGVKLNSRVLLDNVNIPQNSIVYGILLMQPSDYAINVNRLLGSAVMKVRSLKALGVTAIPVSLDIWNKLPDFDKVNRLAREIPFHIRNTGDEKMVN